MVDDFEMGITHVIRGEDHISNTPRQILMSRSGRSRPQYAHIPLILAPDRSKLSKRHGALDITEYRNRGYMSEAICNYLALLGWNPETIRKFFSLDELAELFDLGRVQKSGAVFDVEKLKWINREYLKKHPNEILKKIKKSASDVGWPQNFYRLAWDVFPRRKKSGGFLGQGASLAL